LKKLAFSGIHMANPALFEYMPSAEVFSIMDVYLKAAEKENIVAYEDCESHWFDIGNLDNLEKARNFISDSGQNDH
jgi:NDP-sugar pyrophosphorylase family protein